MRLASSAAHSRSLAAIFSIAGYIYYLVRQARETAARIRELDEEQAAARGR